MYSIKIKKKQLEVLRSSSQMIPSAHKYNTSGIFHWKVMGHHFSSSDLEPKTKA